MEIGEKTKVVYAGVKGYEVEYIGSKRAVT